MKLTIRTTKEGHILTFFLGGKINEMCELPEDNIEYLTEVRFDLDKVSFINSTGIGKWVTWIKNSIGERKVYFRNVPEIIVDQMNGVKGFLPNRYEIESFYVPYYIGKTDEVHHLLAKKEEHFVMGNENSKGSNFIKNEIQIGGLTADIDVLAEKYFKFLKINNYTDPA